MISKQDSTHSKFHTERTGNTTQFMPVDSDVPDGLAVSAAVVVETSDPNESFRRTEKSASFGFLRVHGSYELYRLAPHETMQHTQLMNTCSIMARLQLLVDH